MRENELGQPIGFAVDDWRGAAEPVHEVIEGARCRLEPLSADRHANALHEAFAANVDASSWTYLPYGPFASAEAYAECVRGFEALGEAGDTLFFAIVDLATGAPVGVVPNIKLPSKGKVFLTPLLPEPNRFGMKTVIPWLHFFSPITPEMM